MSIRCINRIMTSRNRAGVSYIDALKAADEETVREAMLEATK